MRTSSVSEFHRYVRMSIVKGPLSKRKRTKYTFLICRFIPRLILNARPNPFYATLALIFFVYVFQNLILLLTCNLIESS